MQNHELSFRPKISYLVIIILQINSQTYEDHFYTFAFLPLQTILCLKGYLLVMLYQQFSGFITG